MKKERKYTWGRPLTPEHKAKLSAAKLGKPKSEETRKKMSEAWTPERKQKLREQMTGKAKSPEVREKIRQGHLAREWNDEKREEHSKKLRAMGRKLSDEHRAKLRAGMKVYWDAKRAAKEMNNEV